MSGRFITICVTLEQDDSSGGTFKVLDVQAWEHGDAVNIIEPEGTAIGTVWSLLNDGQTEIALVQAAVDQQPDQTYTFACRDCGGRIVAVGPQRTLVCSNCGKEV